MKRNFFRLLLSAVLLMCCMIMNAAIEPTMPQTDENGSYKLSTAAELYWFADYVNSDSQHASACAMLTADITMNTNVLNSSGNLNSDTFDAWTPIGGHTVDYAGEFNGNGHTTTHNAQKAATCTTDGNIEYWHCSTCGNNYSDEACTNPITGSVVIPATHHANKKHVDYKAPTADAEGNIEYWHCPDCNKNFEDNGCTKEIAGTDYVLAKLLNVLHIDFNGTSTPIENEHYLDATEIGFTEKGDIIFTTNKQADNKPTVTYPASMIKEIGFFNGTPTVELKANEDPKNKGDYYTTFYSSLEAYAIPEGVKAYTATQDDGTEILNLSEINGGVIPAGEAVVLKSTGNSYSLAVSDFDDNTGTNVLQGTDVEISAPTGCYVLSGTAQLGMGLYPWTAGKSLSANKAYLQLIKSSPVKAIIFRFDDGGTTGISETTPPDIDNGPAYNLNGIQVNDHYNGIIIRNGKKTLEK